MQCEEVMMSVKISTESNNITEPVIVPQNGLIHENDKQTEIIRDELHELAKRVLISRTYIKNRVISLAAEISSDYKKHGIDEIYIIPVLKGAVMFSIDLAKAIYDLHTISLKFDFIRVSSYGNKTTTSGEVSITGNLDDIQGKHVLLIEDIADTGLTLNSLKSHFLEDKKVQSLKICVLLDKEQRRYEEFKELKIDYIGFKIPNRFIAGYGIDCAGLLREMPFIITVAEKH